MEEKNSLTGISCCYSCLCKNDEKLLCSYKVQSTLKEIFQVEEIILCFVCKRIAQHAEGFIKNVESNQILLETLKIKDTILDNLKDQIQPLIRLVQLPLHVFDIGDSDEAEIEVEVKQEGYEDDKLEGFDEDFIENNTDHDLDLLLKEEENGNDPLTSVKQELKLEGSETKSLKESLKQGNFEEKTKEDEIGTQDDKLEEEEENGNDPLTSLKQELELEGSETKSLKESLKQGNFEEKTKEDEIGTQDDKLEELRIERIIMTREQCMEERSRAAKNEKYINAPFKCEDCVRWFTTKYVFDKHMKVHKKEAGRYVCDICKRRSKKSELMAYHKRYHTFRYKCLECGLVYVSLTIMKVHYRATHLRQRAVCPFCKKIYHGEYMLSKHIARLHKSGKLQCHHCHKNIFTKSALISHMMLRHPQMVSTEEKQRMENAKKKLVCDQCGHRTAYPSLLRNHMETHKRPRAPRRRKVQKPEQRPYCVECDKYFEKSSQLNHHWRHSKLHVKYSDMPLSCPHCEERFIIKKSLTSHINKVHRNYKPYKCDQCDKAYLGLHSLKEHRQFVHEGRVRERRFPCPVCGKLFKRNCTLKEHMYTHSFQRPYKCSQCDVSYANTGSLSTHVKKVHKSTKGQEATSKKKKADTMTTRKSTRKSTMLPEKGN